MNRHSAAAFLLVFALACGGSEDKATEGEAVTATLKLTSPAFAEGGMIPAVHTCDGADRSPALAWSDVPQGTVSFALICDDPDAPVGTWVHWVLYDIAGDAKGLPEDLSKEARAKLGALEGTNSWKRPGYGGPCPPSGTHRYFFRLFALDTKLNLAAGADPKALEKAMAGHVLAEGRLMGRYRRS